MSEPITRKENTRRIIVLVFAILILLAGGGLAGHQMNKIKELEEQHLPPKLQDLREVKRQAVESHRLVEDVSVPVGFRIAETWSRPDMSVIPTNRRAAGEFLNFASEYLAEYEIVYDGWNTQKKKAPDMDNPLANVYEANPAGQNPLHLATIFLAVDEKINNWKAEVDAFGVSRQSHIDTVEQELEEIARVQREETEKIDSLQQEVETLKTRYYEIQEQYSGEIRREEQKLHQVREEIAEVKQRVEALEKVLRDEIDEYRVRRDYLELRFKERRARKDPDGRVRFADPRGGYVYIDIVNKDGLFRGTRFEVYGLLKGGLKVPKGEIQVTEVNDLNSRCLILSWNPAAGEFEEGDYIYNDDYIRDKARTFAFAGEFRGPLSEDELNDAIEQRGDKFASPASLETDYLVVGEGYEEDPIYREARKFGIKVIRELDLYQYLGMLNLYKRTR
jgi:hypothetical protein